MESSTRIALITGAGRGLGREVALRLGARGHFVWVAARNERLAEPVAQEVRRSGGQARAVALDVTDPSSIDRARARVAEETPRLDVLVNNAGIMIDGPWVGNTAATVGADVLRQTFDVNFFGVVAVTHAFLPLLQKSGDASIVNVSSVMGSSTLHADLTGPMAYTKPFAYDASKAAVNAFTVHLAAALVDDGIVVNSAHPGWVKTALGTDAADLSVEEGAKTIVEMALYRKSGPTGQFAHNGVSLPF
jgi:NAD(P)-dependent dehydrogenase (short-subunit alcohol dehydrogenase family)